MAVPIRFESQVIHSVPLYSNTNEICKYLAGNLHLSCEEFYLTQNGRKLDSDVTIETSSNIHLHLRLFGGKGGFGSMLRAIGAQIEKTTNREACRDLSGRRLRDINEEQRLKTWLEKQKERDEEAANKTSKKIEKLQAKPKHEFKDDEYFETRSSLAQTVSDAIEEGLQKASCSGSGNGSGSSGENSLDKAVPANVEKKRKRGVDKKKGKKKIKGALWIDANLSSSSDTSDVSDNESEDNSKEAVAIADSESTDGGTKSTLSTSENTVAEIAT